MNIQQQLDELQQRTDSELAKTPAQHKEDNIDKLRTAYEDAKGAAQNAPARVVSTGTAYYNLKDGPDGYKKHIKNTTDTTGKKKEMKSVFDQKIEELNLSITYYDAETTYSKNMGIVLTTLQGKNKSLIADFQKSTIPTNNRKTYYLQMEQGTIDAWITVFNFFIMSGVALLLTHEPKQWAFIGFLLVIVFFLSTIIKIVKKLPYGVSVYTEWGYDPNAKKMQFLYIIPIICLILFVFVMKYFPKT